MATTTDIVSRALRILGVLDPHEPAEAQDFTSGLTALNAMVARWEANGIAMGWSAVNDPDDPLPVPVEAEEALAYNLAVRLRSEYGLVLAGDVIELARDGLALLRRDRAIANPLGWDRLTGYYDVYTDSYR